MIFKTYSNGVKTNRDSWVYNFNRNALTENMSRMIDNIQRRGSEVEDDLRIQKLKR